MPETMKEIQDVLGLVCPPDPCVSAQVLLMACVEMSAEAAGVRGVIPTEGGGEQ